MKQIRISVSESSQYIILKSNREMDKIQQLRPALYKPEGTDRWEEGSIRMICYF